MTDNMNHHWSKIYSEQTKKNIFGQWTHLFSIGVNEFRVAFIKPGQSKLTN